MHLEIDKEFEDLITPLTSEELLGLRQSVIERGCLDAIKIWSGVIIDGHNRYSICTENNIPFEVKEMEFDSRNDAINWIIDNQLGRRNLAPWQMSILRGKRYNAEKKELGGDRRSMYQNDTLIPTREKLADQFGVSSATIQRDGDFAKAAEQAAQENNTPLMQLTKQQILEAAKEIKLEKRELRREAYAQKQSEANLQPKLAISDYIKLIKGDMLNIVPTLGKFDLVVTDPPYGVTDYEWDVLHTREWLEAIVPHLSEEYNLFWFCSPRYAADIELDMRSMGLNIQSRVVWSRRNMAMGSAAKNKFIDTWEMILHAGNRELNFPEEWSDAWFDVQTFAVPQTNFTDKKVHPTQKPEELIRRLVEFGSYPGDKILDPFAGSCTTGYVCPGDRECTLIEREDSYVDIAEQRLGVKRNG